MTPAFAPSGARAAGMRRLFLLSTHANERHRSLAVCVWGSFPRNVITSNVRLLPVKNELHDGKVRVMTVAEY